MSMIGTGIKIGLAFASAVLGLDLVSDQFNMASHAGAYTEAAYTGLYAASVVVGGLIGSALQPAR